MLRESGLTADRRGRRPPRRCEIGRPMRQSAAVAGRSTQGVFRDAKIAAFAVYGYGAGMRGRVNGATFERGFAADLLQVQRAEISDSISDCDRGEPGA